MFRADTFALTALLAALTAIGPLSTDMYLPSLPSIGQLLHASPAQVQLTISTYLVGFAVGQIVYGPVSDRHGRKPVLITATIIFCAATLICALSTSIEMLMAARALQAVGGSGGIVLARAVVRDLYSGRRAGRELSLIGSVMALAPVIAPLIGGVLQTVFGWRSVFILLCASGMAIGALVWWKLPETLPKRAAEPLSLGSMLRSYRGFFRDGGYLAHVGLVVFSFAGLFAWISGSSFVLQQIYGLSAFTFGVAFACGSVGYMTGSALAARFVHQFGLDALMGVGSVGLAAGGLFMVAALALHLDSPVTLVIGAAIYLAGMGLVLGQAIAGAMQPYADRAGAASSLLGFVQLSVAAVVGVAVGQLLGRSAWPMAGGIAAMGCAALFLWVTTRGVRAKTA